MNILWRASVCVCERGRSAWLSENSFRSKNRPQILDKPIGEALHRNSCFSIYNSTVSNTSQNFREASLPGQQKTVKMKSDMKLLAWLLSSMSNERAMRGNESGLLPCFFPIPYPDTLSRGERKKSDDDVGRKKRLGFRAYARPS